MKKECTECGAPDNRFRPKTREDSKMTRSTDTHAKQELEEYISDLRSKKAGINYGPGDVRTMILTLATERDALSERVRVLEAALRGVLFPR